MSLIWRKNRPTNFLLPVSTLSASFLFLFVRRWRSPDPALVKHPAHLYFESEGQRARPPPPCKEVNSCPATLQSSPSKFLRSFAWNPHDPLTTKAREIQTGRSPTRRQTSHPSQQQGGRGRHRRCQEPSQCTTRTLLYRKHVLAPRSWLCGFVSLRCPDEGNGFGGRGALVEIGVFGTGQTGHSWRGGGIKTVGAMLLLSGGHHRISRYNAFNNVAVEFRLLLWKNASGTSWRV